MKERKKRILIFTKYDRKAASTRYRIPIEIHEWDEKTEVEEIQRFDVGIMPLPDMPWTRGKCGFKLIQYMACGLPVVASPVGANKQIVDHGVNGFFCTTTDEWLNALHLLYENWNMSL